MSIRENLIAAKALIDTPEKYAGEHSWRGSMLDAVAQATPASRGFEIALAKLAAALPAGYRAAGGGADYGAITAFGIAETTTHDDIMALFDRAIAKAGATP